jgi:hypothetical protein
MTTKIFTRLSLLLLILLFSFAGTAWAAETWATDPKTGIKIGWSSADWVITAGSWTGPAVGGKAEGKGELDATIRYKDGTVAQFKGEVEMVAGFLDGKAFLKYSDGDSYEGSYKQGLRTGQGIYRFSSGAYYDGNWKNGVYEGKGILKYADGRTYEGDFINGQPDGVGVGKDATGKIIHEGQWKNGMPVEVLKADKVLGVPWGANEADTKKILLQRPKMSGPYPFMSGKDGQSNYKGYFGPFADFPDAWIYVYFYQDKMWQVEISWPLKEDQVLERFNALKQGLNERYGKPYVEKGKYLDSFVTWSLGGKYSVNVQILPNKTKLHASDPTPQTHPFRVLISYYDYNAAETMGLVKSDKPGSGTHKDY